MKLSELKRADINAYAGLTAVLPLGSMEQHGPHLPVGTDYIICNAVCEAAESVQRDKMILLEPMPYGLFSGIIDLKPETLQDVITDVGKSLSKQGIYRLIIASVHGGNKRPLQKFIEEHNDKNQMKLSYFDALSTVPSDGGRHANETETSFMLYIAPDLVDMSKACKEFPPKGQLSKSGVYGDATIATAEKGKMYFEEMVSLLVEAVNS